jgi:uncharacterized RDD family membrane protein YckC
VRPAPQLTLRTPEGVSFSWALAGPVARMLALVIDTCCIFAATEIIGWIVGLLSLISADWTAALGAILFFVIDIGYAIALEWLWRGQTIGKRVLGIRVIDAGGLRLTPGQVVLRNILRAVDALPLFYAVGGVSCVLTRHAQRLGDIAANTVVIRREEAGRPDLPETLTLRYNSLRAYPHLCARLRQRSTPEEAATVLGASQRREELDPSARLELFDALARHFQAKVEFPPEALDGLSSEQYARDVAQVLFETAARKAAQ